MYKKNNLSSAVLAVICLIVTGVILEGCGFSQDSDATVWGRADATEVDINSKIPGRVVALLVKEGDKVKAGQVLARIDKRDLATQADQAQANIEALQAQKEQASATTVLQDQTVKAGVENANAQLEKAETDLELAKSDYSRYSELLKASAVSEQSVDSYRTKYEEARAAYHQAQADMDTARANLLQTSVDKASENNISGKIKQAQASLEEVQVSLDETEVRAPFDGIITAKYVNEGAMISTGMPIVCVQNPLDNWVNFKVQETDLGKYDLGASVTLLGRNEKLKLGGKIVDVSKKPEFATYRSTSERGGQDIITYNVKIQINSEQIRPGMQFRLLN